MGHPQAQWLKRALPSSSFERWPKRSRGDPNQECRLRLCQKPKLHPIKRIWKTSRLSSSVKRIWKASRLYACFLPMFHERFSKKHVCQSLTYFCTRERVSQSVRIMASRVIGGKCTYCGQICEDILKHLWDCPKAERTFVPVPAVPSDDIPKPYQAPAGISLHGTKRKIVECGRAVDAVISNQLASLFNQTVCARDISAVAPATFPTQLSICCTALLTGKFLELSPRNRVFVANNESLLELKISELKTEFAELPFVLSNAAYAICYARYLEHAGKIGILSTPYLGVRTRAKSRPRGFRFSVR
jgi:hypothetical protein